MSAPNPMYMHLDHNFYTSMARASAFMPDGVKNILALLKFLFEELLHWLTVPVEVCLRRRFGVRALSLYPLLQLWTATAFYVVFRRGLSADPVFALFLLVSAGLAALHFVESRRYERSGTSWRHTYTCGIPHGFWTALAPALARVRIDPRKYLTVDNVIRFGEPALCLLVGLVGLLFSKTLGYFLLASAAALALKAHLRHLRYIDAVRDKEDAAVIGQALAGTGPERERVVFVVRLTTTPAPSLGPRSVVEEPKDGSLDKVASPEPGATEPMLSVRCGECGRRLKVKEKYTGRVCPCPGCGEPVKLEAAGAA